MQDLNQNMDELLRKAAEHYPLKINESGWETIVSSLTNTAEKPASRKKNGFIKYTGLFLLFISLLLADGIITRSLKKNGSGQYIQPAPEKKSAVTSSKQNDVSKQSGGKKEQDQPVLQIPFPVTTAEDEDIAIRKTSLLFKEPIPRTNNQQSKNSFYKIAEANRISNPYNNINLTDNKELIEHLSLLKNKNLSVPKVQPPAETTLTKREIFQRKGLYAGVVTGPLFDEVKNQGLKKTGFSAGLVGGYRFNAHWSIESGLLFAKKPYFSTGKYFSMDKMGSMPQGMEILSIEGKNVMLEIPVKLKYDFLRQLNHHFFSTAGLSSFINTNEKNNYLVAINGVQQSMVSSYKNRSRSAAATLDFSAGYEFKIGKSDHIRIEPYLQIPLKGMGVGSMPMKSSGIRLGIIKSFN
ncbi:porin family protein [Terrimonas pollutisoli]|uniref:porin family protein n=1 Tax=Terrimonas pollutisoli TaxID=3034147 RepID=UPI0023ED17CD|nr:porin family protein [Terrimonas sp. H1YJ31]